ncbi:hypothetical protein C8J57DRAFT_1491394 [Mycena rebaudengoi]|nr:hypothetical protein C8J57DRAFT_1491394 [Mycena rebaudengoi]
MTADLGVYISTDGKCTTAERLNAGVKCRRLQPEGLKDTLAEWIPVSEEGLGDDEDVLVEMDKVAGCKERKCYESSDDPMAIWH